MKKTKLMAKILTVFICIAIISPAFSSCSFSKNNSLIINIGYQSVTAQTWGAIIIKNNNIFEDKVKERFPEMDVKINWYNEVSGAFINSSMISGKYQIGFMGDMPCLINGYNSSCLDTYESILVAIDGRGERGKNQGILVSMDSDINEITDLRGKTVSVPIGSSAHNMLLRILNQENILNDVTILHQDVTVASNLLLTSKIDALAAWEPYPQLLSEDGRVRILADGSMSEIDYLTGIMVDKNWAESNKELLVLFLESLLEAHEYINDFPEQSAKILSEETDLPEELALRIIKCIGWDASIYNRDRKTFEESLQFLISTEQIVNYDLNSIICMEYLDLANQNFKSDANKNNLDTFVFEENK